MVTSCHTDDDGAVMNSMSYCAIVMNIESLTIPLMPLWGIPFQSVSEVAYRACDPGL